MRKKKYTLRAMCPLPQEETPALVVSAKKLIERIKAYQRLGTLYYPVKANSAPEVLALVREEGGRFLVNCVYYLEKVRAAGIPGEAILYDNCVARENETAKALGMDVRFFTTDSEEQAAMISARQPDAAFLVKVSSEDASGRKAKFGLQDFAPLQKTLETVGRFRGLSFYIGESAFSYGTFEKQLSLMADAVDHCPVLDIGGSLKGLLEDDRLGQLLAGYRRKGFFDEIFLEPGRNLLNPCVDMLTRVLRRRVLNGEERLHVDASVYSGLMDIYIEGKKLKLSAGRGPEDTPYAVYGHTSDTADFLGTHLLPRDIQEGDIITIADCGAYTRDITCVYSGALPLRVTVR